MVTSVRHRGPGSRSSETFLERFPATVELAVSALIFAIVLGIPIGYLAAKRAGGWLDRTFVAGSLLGVVVPVFVLAYLLKIVFAVGLPGPLHVLAVLPSSGRQDPRIDATHITNFYVLDGLLTREWDAAWDAILHLILPAIALGCIPLAIIVRMTRASVIDVLNEDYVRTAQAKGLSQSMITRRHVLRNAMLPVTTTIGLQTGALLAGAVLTESVFAFNGIGSYLFEAISSLDFVVLQGFILFIAVIYAVVNLIVDLLYGVIDPRLRAAMSLMTAESLRPASLSALMTDPLADERGTSLWQGAFQRLRRNPSAIIGAIIVAAFILVAVFAPLIAPYEPATQRVDRPGDAQQRARAVTRTPARPRPLRLRPVHPADLRRPAVLDHRSRLDQPRPDRWRGRSASSPAASGARWTRS